MSICTLPIMMTYHNAGTHLEFLFNFILCVHDNHLCSLFSRFSPLALTFDRPTFDCMSSKINNYRA